MHREHLKHQKHAKVYLQQLDASEIMRKRKALPRPLLASHLQLLGRRDYTLLELLDLARENRNPFLEFDHIL